MTNELKFISQLAQEFVKNKGKGTCYCYKPTKPETIILFFIGLHRMKHKNTKIFIVTENYAQRVNIKKLLEEKELAYNVTILSKDYVKYEYNYIYDFTFITGINDNFSLIRNLTISSKFTLNILTEYYDEKDFIKDVTSILPILKTNITLNEIRNDHNKFPVEEEHIAVRLDDDDFKQYEKYTEYISQSVSIFGNFDNIEKCRIGDVNLNISAEDFRRQLANENGWRYDLDTSLDFNKEIDKIYNPNALFERANIIYNITRERTNLITDNKNKINKIIELINKLKDKRILIVSKRGEFANAIANNINNNTPYICGEYHDCIPEQYMKDEKGNYITYKSGENKGKLKLFHHKAISSMWLNLFNSDDYTKQINLLSIKNTSSNSLKILIDCVIFTSPLGGSTYDFLLRFKDIEFNTNPLQVYMLYSENTIEYTKLSQFEPRINISIKQNQENIEIDEKNGAVYL